MKTLPAYREIAVALLCLEVIGGNLSAATSSPYAQQVLDNRPMAYWRLDETSGAAVARDLAGGHDCFYTNVELGLAGYSSADPDTAAGFGLSSPSNSFAGEIDNSGSGIPLIDFSAPMGSNGAFSVEAWVNGAGLPQDLAAGIVAKGYLNSEEFCLDEGVPTYPLRFEVRNALGSAYNTYSSLSLYTNSGWHHVVGVCDEANTKVLLYVDGALVASNSIPANSGIQGASGAPVMIGSRASGTNSGADKQFSGYIDEVAIYDYALSAAQVAEDYRVGTSSIPWFASVELRGTNVVLGGYGGPGKGPYALLATTNLNLPFTNWLIATTNTFNDNGTFDLTNPVSPALGSQFYALEALSTLNASNAALWIPTCGAWMGAYVPSGSASGYSNLETQIGRKLDIYRIYHPPTQTYTALSAEELNYITNGNKMMISFKPGPLWTDAAGGNSTVNAQLASLARSVAGVKPHKLMLCIWPEPEPYVNGPKGTNGTTADYVAMWHNVRSIFDANGATNVLWCWDVEGNPTFYSLLPALWPGNAYVDWVGWDVYQSSATEDYVAKQTSRYNWMLTNSTATWNWAAKPWAWFEWGVGINNYYPTASEEAAGIEAINTAVNNHQFPRVVFLDYFDSQQSALLPGAMLSFSNHAHSPYMTQQCP